MSGLKQKVVSGILWVTLERFVTQAVGFVVTMVLARLLTPDDYGTVALLTIFFAVATALVTCGLGNALIQKKDATDLDFNSVFYASIAIAAVIYVIFFFSAPAIARFYGVPVLTPIMRISAIEFVLAAVNSVQDAELCRKMLFYKRFRISLVTSLFAAVCGITLALLGLGVWALVWTTLATSVVNVIAWWTVIAWRPRLMFSWSSVRTLVAYGWKMSAAGIIHTVYMNLYGFLVGKWYTKADLAFVNKGRSVPEMLTNTIDGTIHGVSFPALAQMQDDKSRVVGAMRRMIQSSTFLVFPLLVWLAVCAPEVVRLVFGPQWSGAVVYVQLTCITYALWPFSSINTSAISAIGRSDVYLLLDIIKKGTGLVVMLVSIRYGVFVFMVSLAVIMSVFSVFVNTFANGRLLGYTPLMQIRDVVPSALLSAVMALVVLGVRQALLPLTVGVVTDPTAAAIVLVVSLVVAVATYLPLAYVFKLAPFKEYVAIVLPFLRRRAPRFAAGLERGLA